MFAGAASPRRGGGLRARIERLHRQRRLAGGLRIGLGKARGQARAAARPRAQDQDEAILLHRLDEDLDPRQLDPPEPFGQLQVDLGREPSRAPVDDLSGGVDRAEVPARGDVARAQVELDAERLEDTAPDLVLERIVAEQPEMAGAASRRDPGRYVTDEAARRVGGELREIRQAGRLELRATGLGSREPAEAVERDENDLRRVRNDERRDDVEHRPGLLTPPSRGSRSGRVR